jgi:hypothetical protein
MIVKPQVLADARETTAHDDDSPTAAAAKLAI